MKKTLLQNFAYCHFYSKTTIAAPQQPIHPPDKEWEAQVRGEAFISQCIVGEDYRRAASLRKEVAVISPWQ